MNNPSKAPGGTALPPPFERRGNMVYTEDTGKPGSAAHAATCDSPETADLIVQSLNSHASLVGALARVEKNLAIMAPDGDALAIVRAALSAAQGGKSSVPDYSGLIAAAIAVAESADPEGGDPNDPENEEPVPSVLLNALSAELAKLPALKSINPSAAPVMPDYRAALSDLVNTCGVPTGPGTDKEGFDRAYQAAVKLLDLPINPSA